MDNRKAQDEKEIQEWLEKEAFATNTAPSTFDPDDLHAYRTLFEALDEKPAAGLPYNFSSRVVAQLQERKERAREVRWSLLFIFLLPLVVLGALCLAAFYLNSQEYVAMARTFLSYKWFFVFGITCFFVIEYLDQRLVRKR